jgi:flagellar hook-associated protein 2
VPVSSASNTVTGVLSGVTLNLVSASPGTNVQVSLASDTAQATTAISNFVASYNKLINDVNSQFAFDPAANKAGPLGSDAIVRTLQSKLLSDVTYHIDENNPANNGIVNLASLGVDLNGDGTLSIDSAQLTSVLANQFSDVQNFFQAVSPDKGFAQNFSDDLFNINDTTKGLINVDLAQNNIVQAALTGQINDFEDRLAARQQFLIDQYSRVDTMLRQFPLIMQQLNSQLGTLTTLTQ